MGRNAKIDTIVSMLSSKMANIYGNRLGATLDDCIECAMYEICKRVGETMKADEAMLLPTLHKEFIHEIHSNLANFPNVGVVHKDDIPPSRWLLSRLYFYFEGMIEVQCHQKCKGTLIYHKSCDFIQALTTAL